jgi:exopolysaccharide biosynthesis polyprenyl glycosylphosphotransferase
LRFSGVEVLEQRHAAEIYNSKIPLEMINETTMMEISQTSALPLVGRFKRLFDIVVSVLTGLVCLPLIVLIYVLIKAGAIQSPVFYTQQRVGRFGDLFRMYKFRTMNVGAEDETGAIWAVENDDRVTYLGRLLRRCRMDEIPQLFNILRGDMSFVGPRPERPEFIEELEKRIPYYNERANVLPGLTGWAQVRYPYGNTHDDAARKLEYDLYYIKYLSIGLDVQIILRTIRIVLFGKDGLG